MMWLREARVSSLSQEQLKIEAEKFSRKFEDLDKKTIAKVVENFEKEHKKVHQMSLTVYLKSWVAGRAK